MAKIEQLRELLGIERDRRQLSELDRRVVDLQSRSADVAEVLPEALKSSDRDGRLAGALAGPVESAIHRSVTANPKAFADVLFPVMGPAIRRSIGESIRSFVEGLNQAMDQRFSVQALKWRIKSWRTGVPYREVVLRATLQYRVRLAFLIHRQSGLLIDHAGERREGDIDEDAFSAMLTAIQDFIADSTGGEDDSDLSSASLGGQTVWVLSGHSARLAAVIDGHPPNSARQVLAEKLEAMHTAAGTWIGDFDGSQPCPVDIQELVEQCVLAEARADSGVVGSRSKMGLYALVALAAALLAMVALGIFRETRLDRERAEIEGALAGEPGIVTIDVERQAGRWRLTGMADPLARSPQDVLADLGFADDEVDLAFGAYYSADARIIARRLSAALTDGLDVEIVNETVRIVGETDAAVIADLQRRVLAQPDASRLDLSDLRESDNSRLARLLDGLEVPPSVALLLDADRLLVTGSARRRWADSLKSRISGEFDAIVLDTTALDSSDELELSELRRNIEATKIQFVGGLRPADESPGKIDQLAKWIKRALELASADGRSLRFDLIGHSDASGNTRLNERLREQRANLVIARLVDSGVNPDRLRWRDPGDSTDDDPRLRRVSLLWVEEP